jgi:hypothetical protein
MKFAIAALLLANTQAVLLKGDDGCVKGVAYDYDEPCLKKAEAKAAAKTQHFNGSTLSDSHAKAAASAAASAAAATAAADTEAGAAKAAAAGKFAATSYKDKAAFKAAEAEHFAAVKAKEAAFDAAQKASDDKDAKDLISARAGRDLASSTFNKNRADTVLKQNQDRFAFEKDQLERGQNQDRLKKVIEDTTAKTSELQDKADQRERSNGKLLKALASF